MMHAVGMLPGELDPLSFIECLVRKTFAQKGAIDHDRDPASRIIRGSRWKSLTSFCDFANGYWVEALFEFTCNEPLDCRPDISRIRAAPNALP